MRFLAVVGHLGNPLRFDVFEGLGFVDVEAKQKNVCLRIRKRPEAVVILLSSRVPEVYVVSINYLLVVVEDSGNVVLWKFVIYMSHDETSFSNATISNNHDLNGLE